MNTDIDRNHNFLDLKEKKNFIELLEEAAKCDKTITKISLEFCIDFEDDDMKLLSPFSSSLIDLNLNGCNKLTDEALFHLSKQAPKLTKLSLYWVPHIRDDGILAIAPILNSHVVWLSLSGMKHITDIAIQTLAEYCPNLVHLDLTRNVELRDYALKALGKYCTKLTYLNLYACAHFTDEGLKHLCAGCPKLEFLDICGSRYVTDLGIRYLCENCHELTSLNLTWCFHMTDQALIHMKNGPVPNLKKLWLHGAKALTESGIQALSEGCPKVEFLDINGCCQIEERTFERMKRLFPKLQKLAEL